MAARDPRPSAVLVGVQLPGVDDEHHAADLAELGRLVHTLGLAVVASISQKRSHLEHGTVLGEGKLKELADLTGGKGVVPSRAPERKSKARTRLMEQDEADDERDDERDDGATDPGAPSRPTVVVVDHDITPSQLRNLEKATGAEVMDRAGVIVEIFHRHAKSREARIQVELARLAYLAPRLRESGAGADRQRGGIGGKGAGESAVELDRRRIRDRMAELREELAAIQRDAQNRRALRKGQRRVALVGYTNAGKSSLMRALTGSEVLVADQLFATLDTTVRALHPETKPRILVSDTVGFIQKLPHDLVASFRSTLDEAHEASLLLYLADVSDPTFEAQLAVTKSVLGEIGADDLPSLLILNKADRLTPERRAEIAAAFPDAIVMSALDRPDVAALRDRLVSFFDGEMVEGALFVPWTKQRLVADVYEEARVVGEEYGEEGTTYRVRAHPAALARLSALVAS